MNEAYWIWWYETDEQKDEAGRSIAELYSPRCRCSVCGTQYDPHFAKRVKFCYECGSRIKEKSQEKQTL